MACAIVASGAAFSTASRRAWTLAPTTRVTREAIVSVTFLLPHFARLSHDAGDLEHGRQVLVDDRRIIAGGVARDRQPHERPQELKAALHYDILDVDGMLLGVLVDIL